MNKKNILIIRLIGVLFFINTFPAFGQNIDSLKKILSNSESLEIKYEAAYSLADYYSMRLPDSCITLSKQIREYAKNANNHIWDLRAVFLIGKANLMIDDYNEGVIHTEEGIKLAAKKKEWGFSSRFYHLLGILKYYQTDFESALIALDTSLKIVQNPLLNNFDNILEEEVLYSSIAMVRSQQGYYEQALKTHFNMVRILEPKGTSQELATVYNKIGSIYKKKENYEDAIVYYQKSLAIAKKLDYPYGIGFCLTGIGDIYYLQEKYDSAQILLKEALVILNKINEKGHAAHNLLLQARVFFALNNIDSTLNYGNIAYQIHSKIGLLIGKTESAVFLTDVYLAQNEYTKAKIYLDTALQVVTSTKERPQLRDVYQRYFQYYDEIGNNSQALTYLKKYSLLKDSLDNESNEIRLKDLHESYESEKKDLQIKTQKAELAEEKIKSKLRLWGLVGSLLLLIIIGIGIWKIRQKNKKLSEAKQLLQDEYEKTLKEQQTEKEELLKAKGKLKEYEKRKAELKFNGFSVIAEDIIYVQAQGNYIDIYHRNGKNTIREKLKNLDTRLPIGFYRPHRSFIINLDMIRYHNTKKKEICLSNGQKIPLSDKNIKSFIEAYNENKIKP